ncbi:MAG: hypothetical protein K6E46_07100 [Lachnospiraceae bacterium]|nr:hypothetical protein [Lachnospiraceae bacterium]
MKRKMLVALIAILSVASLTVTGVVSRFNGGETLRVADVGGIDVPGPFDEPNPNPDPNKPKPIKYVILASEDNNRNTL